MGIEITRFCRGETLGGKYENGNGNGTECVEFKRVKKKTTRVVQHDSYISRIPKIVLTIILRSPFLSFSLYVVHLAKHSWSSVFLFYILYNLVIRCYS